jgi:hypothetical protein
MLCRRGSCLEIDNGLSVMMSRIHPASPYRAINAMQKIEKPFKRGGGKKRQKKKERRND